MSSKNTEIDSNNPQSAPEQDASNAEQRQEMGETADARTVDGTVHTWSGGNAGERGAAAAAILTPIDGIATQENLSGLFRRDEKVLEALTSSMRESGFDPATPLVAWRKGDALVLVDGHTRLEAARAAGLSEAPVAIKDFAGDDEATMYAILVQRNRRNLTDREIMKLVQVHDRLKSRGGDRRSAEAGSKISNEIFETSAQRTAEDLGISASMVNRARRALKNPEIAAKIECDELTISGGDAKMREAKKRAQAAKGVTAAAPTHAEPVATQPAVDTQAEAEPAFTSPAAIQAEAGPLTEIDALRASLVFLEKADEVLTRSKVTGEVRSVKSAIAVVRAGIAHREKKGENPAPPTAPTAVV